MRDDALGIPGETTTSAASAATGGRTLDRLVTRRYVELACRARRLLQLERRDHTLQTSGLIHEAYVRMLDLYEVDWRDRSQFLPIAVGVMRRVLIDHARRSRANKRGGDLQRVELNDDVMAAHEPIDILELDRALTRLADRDPVQAQIVENRFFGGLTIEQTGALLALSPATVKRKWTLAQAWLYRELTDTCTTM